MPSLTKHEINRRPFIAGVVILVLAPYILAFLLIFAALFVIATILDAFGSRR